ncbi:D-Ala-D-Ala dipeptidase [Bacteroides pyogenes F0041]|uniref:D-alanyl-D-alanine dipeptidase n=1 Tax=Bacteroides pyogenes F0041 TaxID=1321819 RepID=U2CBY2_9BACE|nr:D-Ala-D-Ala dipeptidase [Bacteroides pyogenes F0041]
MNIIKSKPTAALFLSVLLSACTLHGNKERRQEEEERIAKEIRSETAIEAEEENENGRAAHPKSRMALYMDSLGLKNIAEADTSIIVRLMYATPDNFTGKTLYEDLKEAYLHPEALEALLRAHRALKQRHPSYRFIVYDAARPLSVQQQMWDAVKGTSRYRYVSNPAHGGGLHNYGLAVDIGILDSLGNPLPMGTKVDHLGMESHIMQEDVLVRRGKISEEERQNRLLLRQAMKAGGFRPLPSEWWHFNFRSRDEARRNYPVIP